MSGTTRVSRYQKGKTRQVKTNLDLLEQVIVSSSGICWAICKLCTSSQTTTPASHHSVFYRPDALPAAQPTASKHWRHLITWLEYLGIPTCQCKTGPTFITPPFQEKKRWRYEKKGDMREREEKWEEMESEKLCLWSPVYCTVPLWLPLYAAWCSTSRVFVCGSWHCKAGWVCQCGECCIRC